MILADSDIVIAHLRGIEIARTWMLRTRQDSGPIAVSVVSVAEVVGGMRAAERREVWRLLDSFAVEPVTELVGRVAGEMTRRYRRSHTGIGLGDYLIAATAEVGGFDLATLNVKHFPMFRGLRAPFHV